ncbi:FadR/GntR family transcriptional regulator [Allopontixanthobacter sediminis]|uniref:FCD domain-containing protein n=1 Tax=Allopontixanthobacter sediminis TaxID=1689985 RepID=A0A845B0L0_9SPHN|nr:FadR/GntR family transcriptional regulator [Allopontixanthobacter sediminis]MXP43990.1 FCD domain-containing protein [Allopontixanthobacter sediminis]
MAEQRLFHTIAEQLSEMIEKGVFPAGSRLPGERELAERFDVSRVTIREAEIALQAVGRIEIKTGAGVYVCEEQPLRPGKLPDVSAFELTEARSLIEAEAAGLAAKLMTDETLERLRELLAEMETPDDAVSTAADKQFHALIAKASGNRAMLHTIETLWRMREELPAVKRSYEAICDDDVTARSREHKDILDALEARDPIAARTAMRQHFLRLISSMLDVTEREELLKVRQRATESRQRFLTPADE